MDFRGIFNELKRRNVIKVATVYGITAWLIAQIVSLAANAFGAPGWVMKMVIVLLVVGFPLALIFAWAFELTPEGLKKTDHVPKSVSKTDQTSTKLNRMIIGALGVLLIFVGAERIFFAGSYDETQSADFTHASIAVLPFDNISSGGAEDAYFSDGLSEELLNTLAGVDSMKVAGRTSSFRFKGDDLDMKQIGEQLDVRHILEGSVRKAGNKVRITVQLVNAENGDYMWSKTYDRTLDDIFAIQEEISKAVLSELKVRLLPEAKERLETIPTGDVEAYQMYLKANQLVAIRNIDDINRGIDLYKQAIDLDPGFAKAHARLAIAYNLQGYYGNVPMKEVQQNTRDHADRALFLNSDLGEAYAAIGLYYWNEGEAEKARDAFLRSLRLNRNQPDVHGWLGTIYGALLNSPAKMKAQFKKMHELDPLGPTSMANYAVALASEGKRAEGIKILRKNLRENPNYLYAYNTLSEFKAQPPLGQVDSAFVYTHKALQQDSSNTRSLFFHTLFAIRLDIKPLATYYYRQLADRVPNNPDFITTAPYYANYTGNYAIIENTVFPFVNQHGIPQLDILYPLTDYGLATGRTDQVLAIFKELAPGLFKNPIPPITQANYENTHLLISLMEAKGNNKRVKQLTNAYCSGVKDLAATWADGENANQFIGAKATCLLHRGEYDKALPFVKEYFLEKNGIYYASRLFDRPAFSEAMQRPGYQQVYKKVQSELARQRQNVIGYLKKQGDWKPEWEE